MAQTRLGKVFSVNEPNSSVGGVFFEPRRHEDTKAHKVNSASRTYFVLLCVFVSSWFKKTKKAKNSTLI
jgi:hypothetical protein